MKRLTSQNLRLRPWLHAAIALYLLGAVFLITVHQHHGALSTDCALCTISHTPAVLAPAAQQVDEHTPASVLPPVPDDRVWNGDFFQASRSRAPPQV